MTGDTLLTLSWKPGLTWFTPEGEFIRSERFNLHQAARVPCRMLGVWELLADGSLITALGDNLQQVGCPPEPESPWRESGLIVRSIHHDGRFDTIGLLPAAERNSPNYRAYGTDLALAFAPDRVYAGDTGADEILVLGFEGDTLQVLSTPFEPVPVPREAKRKDRRRIEQPEGSILIGNEYLYPEFYPRFGRMLTDELGFLWVMAYPKLRDPDAGVWLSRLPLFTVEDGGARWRVLGRDGTIVAEVRTPPRFFPLEIGKDYVLGISKDEFDVHTVEVYALTR
jgi:hypothetical protein